MSNSIDSYTKENYKKVTYFRGIGLLLIMIVLTVNIVKSLNQEVVVEEHLIVNRTKGSFHFQNDTINTQIAIPEYTNRYYRIVYNLETKAYSIRSRFYPYTEFIPTVFLLFMLTLNYLYYKVRMKSDKP